MSHPVYSPRKLIEVALPLDAINTACAREKSIRHGHPSTLHLWWARRPLAAARAVIFAQLVNDPGYQQGGGFKYGMNKKDAAIERKRLFKIIEDLVLWENTTNEEVLERAREEIRRSWREVCELNKNHPQAKELFNPDKLPALHDPFAGGGSIPLEAQRLGLEAYASDLNPVAVLINKAMIEIPPKFAGRPPVNPESRSRIGGDSGSWPGATGIAEDVRYYGAWMREEANKRIGHLYPPVEITPEMSKDRPDLKTLVGKKLTVIAWLWARTVKCPNPACGLDMPLLSSFVLSSKPGREVYLVPIIKGNKIYFDITGTAPTHLRDYKNGYKRGKSGIFECAYCGALTTRNYTAEYGVDKGLGIIQSAIICQTPSGKIYLPVYFNGTLPKLPDTDISGIEVELAPNTKDCWCRNFGLKKVSDLFYTRQLIALITFSNILSELNEKIRQDAVGIGIIDDLISLESGGKNMTAYAEAVATYLALAIGRSANYWSALTPWGGDFIVQTFGHQAIPMVWDSAECNPFSNSTGNWIGAIEWVVKVIMNAIPANKEGHAFQQDAQTQTISFNKIISTDPPYYDNIIYADLSDFFYVWLRKALRRVFPSILATISVPKTEELVAASYRHKNRDEAEKFFLNGMTQAMRRLAEQSHPEIPISIYYAFKQSETKDNLGTFSTGWQTFLESVCRAGLQINGTWPMRTERDQGLKTMPMN